MKKTLFNCITLFLTLSWFSVSSQQYQPIPDSNARWVIQQDDGWGGFFYKKYVLSEHKNDTVVNNKSYIKIYGTTDMYEHNYYGAFRNGQNGISYYLPKNSQQEYILRDFTKNEADTIFWVAYEYNHNTWVLDFIVDSTELTNSGPYSYKIMYLSTLVKDTVPEQGYQPLVWMEKIGSFGGGVFNNFRGGLNMQRLYCMSFNDTIYYDSKYWVFRPEDISYKFGMCPNPVGIDEQDANNLTYNYGPNPATSHISLSSTNTILKLYSLNGLLILTSSPGDQVISLEGVKPGVYIATIIEGREVVGREKIIIQ